MWSAGCELVSGFRREAVLTTSRHHVHCRAQVHSDGVVVTLFAMLGFELDIHRTRRRWTGGADPGHQVAHLLFVSEC